VNVAIIPARGGSKRIPRKNIREFCGRPMIAWSIEAARASGCFERLIVSTDDAGIADVARSCGAEVPFMRPSSLADDHAATVPVIAHAVDWLQGNGCELELACCLYATAPLVNIDDLRAGQRLLQGGRLDYVFSATRFAYPVQRALRLCPDGRVAMLDPAQAATRSQDLEPVYHDAGQFYWGRPAAWLGKRSILGPASGVVLVPAHRVQDIDTEEDWRRAELLFMALRGA
jgi:pseudaminic acid cytidylyltransferase